MIGSCRRREPVHLNNPENYSVGLVLALNNPKRKSACTCGDDESTTYYRDENQVHYVPKRSLEDVWLISSVLQR